MYPRNQKLIVADGDYIMQVSWQRGCEIISQRVSEYLGRRWDREQVKVVVESSKEKWLAGSE